MLIISAGKHAREKGHLAEFQALQETDQVVYGEKFCATIFTMEIQGMDQ